MVRTLQAVFDADLSRNQVDQTTMHKMRADAARPLFGQEQGFTLNAGQPADTGPDRAPGTQLLIFRQIGKTSIFQSLSSRIDSVDDKRIYLPLYFVINALVWVEAPWVILGLYLACNMALLVAGIEAGDDTAPDLLAIRLAQVVSTSAPKGVTSPSPVTTTRRMLYLLAGL